MKFSINRKRNLFKVQFTSVLNDFFHGLALGKQLSTLVDFELKHRTFSIWPCFSNCFNMTCWQIEFHFQLRIIFDFCSTFTEKKRTIVFLQFFLLLPFDVNSSNQSHKYLLCSQLAKERNIY